jgi:hypothetical protein
MMYLGIVNYTFAWYDPKGHVLPVEYADLAADLFPHGLLTGPETRRKWPSLLRIRSPRSR